MELVLMWLLLKVAVSYLFPSSTSIMSIRIYPCRDVMTFYTSLPLLLGMKDEELQNVLIQALKGRQEGMRHTVVIFGDNHTFPKMPNLGINDKSK